MTIKRFVAGALALVCFGLAQPSPFSIRVGLFEIIAPTVRLEARVPISVEFGVLGRAGLTLLTPPFPLIQTEVYVFKTQDQSTVKLGGGRLGWVPPMGFPFLGFGFEHAWGIGKSGIGGSVELGLVFVWYSLSQYPGPQVWSTIPIPTLRFNLIFPLGTH